MVAKDIAAEGAEQLWVLDSSGRIMYLESNEWCEYPGDARATAIAVSRDGVPYIIDTSTHISQGNGTG